VPHSQFRAPLALALAVAFCWSLLAVAPAAAVGPKVVIIVGPTGSLTNTYRSHANQVATTAAAAGAEVVKVYSPNATWANVRAAVAGANVIVYFGHGNGFPSPYSSTENTDRVNGWGLNRTTTNGDGDNWSTTMAYCGEKALLGTLTSSDGAAQWSYCGGSSGTDGIAPAPGFVMIYSSACYAPGAGETDGATEAQARERVRNYSYPALALGAGAYFATDLGASSVVDLVLRNPDTGFGQLAQSAAGYDAAAQRHFDHPDLAGAEEIWIQRTYAMGRSDYWYAYAGDPARTPAGGTAVLPPGPQVTRVKPADGLLTAGTSARPNAYFDMPVTGLSGSSFVVRDSFGFRVPGKVRWNAELNQATLVPARRLVTNEAYAVQLSSAIRNLSGSSLEPYTWSFTTRDDGGDGHSAAWSAPRPLVFRQGTHTGYQFDGEGRMTAVKTATLAVDSGVGTTTRRTIPRQSGYWFFVVDGKWAGHWIRQSAALYLADEGAPTGAWTAASYNPTVTVTIAKGTHTACKLDSAGAMTAQKTATVSRAVGAQAAKLRAFPNQAGGWFKIVSGTWSGFWLRASDVVYRPAT
jgi:hypothetical protein